MTTRDELRDLTVERLRQEIPDVLDWIPWGDLPALRWAADDSPVDRRVPRGWLVLAFERRNPLPDGDLLQQTALFRADDAADLANWLLEGWLALEAAVPEPTAERRAELRGIAEKAARVAKRFGRGGSAPDERFRQLLAQEENRPPSSALPYRGLLAVVGACGDHRAIASAHAFLTTRHPERPDACRVLLRMLAGMKAPEASAVLEEARRIPALSSPSPRTKPPSQNPR